MDYKIFIKNIVYLSLLQIAIDNTKTIGVIYIDVYQIENKDHVLEISLHPNKTCILVAGSEHIEWEPAADEPSRMNPKTWFSKRVTSWKTEKGVNRDPHGCLNKGK